MRASERPNNLLLTYSSRLPNKDCTSPIPSSYQYFWAYRKDFRRNKTDFASKCGWLACSGAVTLPKADMQCDGTARVRAEWICEGRCETSCLPCPRCAPKPYRLTFVVLAPSLNASIGTLQSLRMLCTSQRPFPKHSLIGWQLNKRFFRYFRN